MKLPDLKPLQKLKKQISPVISGNKILILVSMFLLISTISFVVWAIKVRNDFAASLKSQSKVSTDATNNSPSPDLANLNIDNLSASDSGVLGISNSSSDNGGYSDTAPVPTPFPEFTLVPVPTYTPSTTSYYTPVSQSTSSSTSTCAGTPTAYNSEAIVSSSSTQINNSITLTLELLDCNNNYGPVDDTLTVTLSSTDSSARINGSTSPVSVKAQNGKVSVSINSQNAGTDTFVVHDVTRNFDVTDPNNHNPSVIFTSNSTGNQNCTTGAGVPNSWFSDVYVSPTTVSAGSNSTFNVIIRDCFKNTVSASDSLSISLSSGDSSTQVNGNNLPYSISAQNGQVSFNVSSQNAGTSTLIVQDTTSSFTVTDANNNNPSVVFSSASTPNPTPTPTVTSSTSPTTAPTSAPTQAPADTPTSPPAPTSTTAPAPSPTPETLPSPTGM